MTYPPVTTRRDRFRSTIETFINERRDAKLKGKGKDDPETAQKYAYDIWLADAARRVSQIQAVTHVLKATHPDARGTSVYVEPKSRRHHEEVGTHCLGPDQAVDVVGNAAALDVFKFLKQEVEGRPLLEWMRENDSDLCAALSDDGEVARTWMQAFSDLIRQDATHQSHETAKQLYWLTGTTPSDNTGFHLLQPMFSSSLAHHVHTDIQDARFGDDNKAARKARREGKPRDAPYRSYPNLVVRKLGGTKPQNISQLNSERGGVNYLLDSLPPTWKTTPLGKLTSSERVWNAYRWRPLVKRLLGELIAFLKSNPPTNIHTRRHREGLEQALGAQLVAFADVVQRTRDPGWTHDLQDELPIYLQLWLDSGRLAMPPSTADPEAKAKEDAFRQAYHWGDWPDQVAGEFGNWLNRQLHDAGLRTVGSVEYRHWTKQAIVDAAWPIPMQRRAHTDKRTGEQA